MSASRAAMASVHVLVKRRYDPFVRRWRSAPVWLWRAKPDLWVSDADVGAEEWEMPCAF